MNSLDEYVERFKTYLLGERNYSMNTIVAYVEDVLEFKEFLRTRIDDFNPEFIETHGFTPERYREKYIRDMKVLRKVIL